MTFLALEILSEFDENLLSMIADLTTAMTIWYLSMDWCFKEWIRCRIENISWQTITSNAFLGYLENFLTLMPVSLSCVSLFLFSLSLWSSFPWFSCLGIPSLRAARSFCSPASSRCSAASWPHFRAHPCPILIRTASAYQSWQKTGTGFGMLLRSFYANPGLSSKEGLSRGNWWWLALLFRQRTGWRVPIV